MAGGELVGPIKGYPLRVDFATAPTQKGRILLVGESAGLVSPLTGEGIDFALESGKLAAEFMYQQFADRGLTISSLQGYDAMLRQHFQRLFVFLNYIRQIYINPVLMNRALIATRRFPEIKDLLVKVMLGQEDAASMINFATFRKVVFGL